MGVPTPSVGSGGRWQHVLHLCKPRPSLIFHFNCTPICFPRRARLFLRKRGCDDDGAFSGHDHLGVDWRLERFPDDNSEVSSFNLELLAHFP